MIRHAPHPIGTDVQQATDALASRRAAEAAQLALLASTVLQKSHDDLSALAQSDPGIVWDWIEAFARLKAKAEADARLWSAAMASLSTASSAALATAE